MFEHDFTIFSTMLPGEQNRLQVPKKVNYTYVFYKQVIKMIIKYIFKLILTHLILKALNKNVQCNC